MAQSHHSTSGEIRIPKNIPYNRIRHIDWRDHSDLHAPEVDNAAHDAGVPPDEHDDDEPKVWTF